MQKRKAKIDGLKRDYSDKAKKLWYAQNRAKRFSARFLKGNK